MAVAIAAAAAIVLVGFGAVSARVAASPDHSTRRCFWRRAIQTSELCDAIPQCFMNYPPLRPVEFVSCVTSGLLDRPFSQHRATMPDGPTYGAAQDSALAWGRPGSVEWHVQVLKFCVHPWFRTAVSFANAGPCKEDSCFHACQTSHHAVPAMQSIHSEGCQSPWDGPVQFSSILGRRYGYRVYRLGSGSRRPTGSRLRGALLETVMHARCPRQLLVRLGLARIPAAHSDVLDPVCHWPRACGSGTVFGGGEPSVSVPRGPCCPAHRTA